jgi:hypothetical protein
MSVVTGFLTPAGLLALAGLPVLAWVCIGLVRYSERPARLVPYIVAGAATIYLVSAIVIISVIF